jgi:hypothetical protein
MHFSTIETTATTIPVVSAHDNHDIAPEITVREAVFQYTTRDVSQCAAKLKLVVLTPELFKDVATLPLR